MGRIAGVVIGLLVVCFAAGAVELSFGGGIAHPNYKVYTDYFGKTKQFCLTAHELLDVTKLASVELDVGAWSRKVGPHPLYSQLPSEYEHPWRGIYEAIRLVPQKPIVTLNSNESLNLDGGIGVVFHQAWEDPPRIRHEYFKAETHMRGQLMLRANLGPVYLAGEWQPPITNRSSVDLLASFGYRFWGF